MITLRIKEIAEDKGLTLDELSNLSGVTLDDIHAYTTIETLTKEIAANLRKIAAKLNVPVVDLVKPVREDNPQEKRNLWCLIFPSSCK